MSSGARAGSEGNEANASAARVPRASARAPALRARDALSGRYVPVRGSRVDRIPAHLHRDRTAVLGAAMSDHPTRRTVAKIPQTQSQELHVAVKGQTLD